MGTHSFRVATTALLVVAAFSTPVYASTFEVDIREYNGSNLICSPSPVEDRTSAGPITCNRSRDVAGPVGFGSVSLTGSAGRGWVRTRVNSSVTANQGFNFGYGGCANIRTILDDVLVSGPPGQVTAELIVNIIGSTAGDAPRDDTPIRFAIRFAARTPGGGFRDTSSNSIQIGVPDDVDTTLASGPITFDSGDSLEIELEIVAEVGIISASETRATDVAFADVPQVHGMSFRTASPVIDISPGYTIDSADGRIVDNSWEPTMFEDAFECEDTTNWSSATDQP